MVSVWKPGYQAALYGLVAVVLVGTVVEASDYPVHVRFKDYDDDSKNDDVIDYWQDVARETGFGGIAIGVGLSLISLPLFFICWCGCCRRCASTITCKKADSSPGPKEKRWNLIVLGVLLLCTCIVAVLLGIFAGRSTDDVVDGIDKTVDSVDEAARFLCGGELQMRFFADDNDLSFEAIRQDIVATKGLAHLCDINSVAAYLLSVNVSIDNALDSIKRALDPGLDPLLHAVGNLKDAFVQTSSNVTELITISQQTVTNSNELVSQINTLNAIGSLSIDTTRIPTSDLTDLNLGKIEVTKAESDVINIDADIRDAIVNDLQTVTINTINNDISEVTVEINELFNDLVDKLKDLRSARKDIKNAGDDVESARTVVVGVTGTIVALFAPFILMGTLGTTLRKENKPGCCSCVCLTRLSAVCIWSFALLLVVVAGAASVLHIFVEDVCPVLLEGNSQSDGLGLIAVNIDGQTFKVGDTTVDVTRLVKPMLTCPKGCEFINVTNDALAMGTIGTPTGCDNTTSFGLMLGIEQEFNFLSEIQTAVDDIKKNIHELNKTAEIASATTNLASAVDLLDLDLTGSYEPAYYRGMANGVLADASASDTAKAAATSILSTLDAIDQSLADALDVQGKITVATRALDAGLALLQTTTTETIVMFVNRADSLVDLTVRIVEGSRGALRCDWLGSAYGAVVDGALCGDVNDGFQTVVILAAFGVVVVYLSLFVLLHAGRAATAGVDGDSVPGLAPSAEVYPPATTMGTPVQMAVSKA